MKLREKFLAADIPYDDLDVEMIEILDVLNFHLGLRTKFCCYGHRWRQEIYIMFDESVTESEIEHLAEQVGKDYVQLGVSFNKWIRHFPVQKNWMMRFNLHYDPTSKAKRDYLDYVTKSLRKCEPVKGRNVVLV